MIARFGPILATLFAVLIGATGRADPPTSLSWTLGKQHLVPQHSGWLDERGQPVWHFLRTTTTQGTAANRSWPHDGKYEPLPAFSETIYDSPIRGWIYQDKPRFQSPFVGVMTSEFRSGTDLPWRSGQLVLAPGPDSPIIVGWQSPADGTGTIALDLQHTQTCCEPHSQVNWYLEQGPAPGAPKFQPRTLARGHLNFDQRTQGRIRLSVQDIAIAAGDFVYLIVDCDPNGNAVSFHGDGCRLKLAITLDDPVFPTPPIYENDIAPILAAKCTHCHGRDVQEARLNLSTLQGILFGGESGAAVTPGHTDQSFLHFLIQQGEMPPADEKPLTAGEIKKITRWIDSGAGAKQSPPAIAARTFIPPEARSGWAFSLPRRIHPPQVRATHQVNNPIDRFLLARLEPQGLKFSAPASKTALLRRVHYDLTGLPPTPDELRSFLNDPQPAAYERVVDRLLASPAYGQRWGRHWMDAVGYVDTRLYDGDATTVYPHNGIWRYRDYIIRAHNQDKPWDRFLSEQLAGDMLSDWRQEHSFDQQTIDQLAATGFLRNVEDHTSEPQYGVERRYIVLFDLMEMVSSSLLGLSMHCSRCHNHKFDPLTQRDYFGLMAYLENGYDVKDWKNPKTRWVADVGPGKQKEIDQNNATVTAGIQMLTEQLKQVRAKDDKPQIAKLEAEIAGQRKRLQSYGQIPVLLQTDKAWQSRVLRRGQWNRPGIAVAAAPPEVLRGKQSRPPGGDGSPANRLQLAGWLTSDQNPLTARVIANRVWHHHFGRGLVATLGNFGATGSGVSHPKLLDWLACEFQEQGWSLKYLHRLIVSSTAYQQSSRRLTETDRGQAVDPQNALLWRQNLRRVESEILRDALLAVSGQLNAKTGGPPVAITAPADGLSTVINTPTREQHRRSVYLFHRRVYPLKFMETFDSPVMPINCRQRSHSTTVLQSLALLNSDFVLECSRQLGRQLPAQPTAAIDALYRRTLTRHPTAEETAACTTYLADQSQTYIEEGQPEPAARRQAICDLCHMILCTNEFLYIE